MNNLIKTKYVWVFLISLFVKDITITATETTDTFELLEAIQTLKNPLRAAQVIFRPGARNIDRPYPADPYADESFWPGGYGQLTCKGEIQGYELGRDLRNRFKSFISYYYIPKEIHVLSSDMDRTIQMAYAVLAGLYTPNEFNLENPDECKILPLNDIPVHTIPMKYDNVLRQEAGCPKYAKLQDDFHKNSDAMKNVLKKHEDLLNYFAEKTEIQNFQPVDFAYYYDTLIVENYFKFPLPKWSDRIFNSKEAADFDELFTFNRTSLTYTDEMKRLRVGPLINKIIENFNESLYLTSPTQFNPVVTPKKMYLMSGHDVTLTGLLHTLGVNEQTQPSYAAAIIIEMFGDEEDHEPKDFLIKVSYRTVAGEEKSTIKYLDIPKCPAPCTYGKFQEILNPLVPKDWETECKLFIGSTIEEWTTVGVVIVVVIIVIVVTYVCVQAYLNPGLSPYTTLETIQAE